MPSPAPDPAHRLRLSERLAAGVIGGGVMMGIYNLTARLAADSDRPQHTLPTLPDDLVGLHPWAMLIYGGLYFQVIAPLVLISDRRVMLRAALACLVLILAGVPVWLHWPVVVPRDPVYVDSVFTWGLTLVRWLDPPTNCFPSMHVAEAYLAALILRRQDPALGNVLLVSASAIWWSTLALDQHWFVDGLAGLLLALAVDRVFFSWRPLPAAAHAPTARAGLLWAVGVYVVMFLAFALPWWTGWLTPADIPARW